MSVKLTPPANDRASSCHSNVGRERQEGRGAAFLPTRLLPATAPPVDPVVQARPADEAALMTHDQDSAEMRAAPNDIIRTQVEARLDKAFCAAVNKVKEFSNWTGRVQRINFNGYFEIDLGGYITLHDIDITPSTELFKVIAALREGQPIKVSGYFKHGAEACSIFVNREFSVHLTKITPL